MFAPRVSLVLIQGLEALLLLEVPSPDVIRSLHKVMGASICPKVSLVLTQGLEALLLSAPIAGGISRLDYGGGSAQLRYGSRNPRVQVSPAGVTGASIVPWQALASHTVW